MSFALTKGLSITQSICSIHIIIVRSDSPIRRDFSVVISNRKLGSARCSRLGCQLLISGRITHRPSTESSFDPKGIVVRSLILLVCSGEEVCARLFATQIEIDRQLLLCPAGGSGSETFRENSVAVPVASDLHKGLESVRPGCH